MDLSTTPDTYTPSVDDAGNYVDNVPPMKNGLYCPCGSRKDHIYDTAAKFNSHIKAKIHQKWLAVLNANKANYYVETLKMKELIDNQQKIIQKLETQMMSKLATIDYLTIQLGAKAAAPTLANLLDIN
jgi:hypothetical protein